jgi:hypothetical protein
MGRFGLETSGNLAGVEIRISAVTDRHVRRLVRAHKNPRFRGGHAAYDRPVRQHLSRDQTGQHNSGKNRKQTWNKEAFHFPIRLQSLLSKSTSRLS